MPSSLFPTPPGSARAPPSVPPRLNANAVWYAGQEEPWIILTDLPPQEVGVSWYALRFCIELGFKAIKRLGWKWDKTQRTDPTRISRHWLVLSVATLLALGYGTRVEDANDRRICSRQPASAAQSGGFQSSGPSDPSGAHRQRVPPRYQLRLTGRR